MGGPEKVERQHHFGKLTIRERVQAIADDDSFDEIGTLAGVGHYDDDVTAGPVGSCGVRGSSERIP